MLSGIGSTKSGNQATFGKQSFNAGKGCLPTRDDPDPQQFQVLPLEHSKLSKFPYIPPPTMSHLVYPHHKPRWDNSQQEILITEFDALPSRALPFPSALIVGPQHEELTFICKNYKTVPKNVRQPPGSRPNLTTRPTLCKINIQKLCFNTADSSPDVLAFTKTWG